MPTVILSMDVSCGAEKIRRCLMRGVDGVDTVEVFPDTDRVVVTGTASAASLQSRIESKLWRNVHIVSDRAPSMGLRGSDDDDSSSSEEEDSDEDDDEEEESSSSSGADGYLTYVPAPTVTDSMALMRVQDDYTPSSSYYGGGGGGYPAVQDPSSWYDGGSSNFVSPDASAWYGGGGGGGSSSSYQSTWYDGASGVGSSSSYPDSYGSSAWYGGGGGGGASSSGGYSANRTGEPADTASEWLGMPSIPEPLSPPPVPDPKDWFFGGFK